MRPREALNRSALLVNIWEQLLLGLTCRVENTNLHIDLPVCLLHTCIATALRGVYTYTHFAFRSFFFFFFSAFCFQLAFLFSSLKHRL